MKGKAPALIAAIALALSPAASAWAQGATITTAAGVAAATKAADETMTAGAAAMAASTAVAMAGHDMTKAEAGAAAAAAAPAMGSRADPGGRQGRGGVEPWMPPMAPRRTEAYRPGRRAARLRAAAGGAARPELGRPALQRLLHARTLVLHGPPPSASYGQPGFQLGFSPWQRGASAAPVLPRLGAGGLPALPPAPPAGRAITGCASGRTSCWSATAAA